MENIQEQLVNVVEKKRLEVVSMETMEINMLIEENLDIVEIVALKKWNNIKNL